MYTDRHTHILTANIIKNKNNNNNNAHDTVSTNNNNNNTALPSELASRLKIILIITITLVQKMQIPGHIHQ